MALQLKILTIYSLCRISNSISASGTFYHQYYILSQSIVTFLTDVSASILALLQAFHTAVILIFLKYF